MQFTNYNNGCGDKYYFRTKYYSIILKENNKIMEGPEVGTTITKKYDV